MQVSRTDGSILGYFKMPITSGAGERLRNEAAFLRKLSTFPQLRPHIPQLLFAGDWNNSTIMFQSPLDGETGPVSFTELYQGFPRTPCNIASPPGWQESCWRKEWPGAGKNLFRGWERSGKRWAAKL